LAQSDGVKPFLSAAYKLAPLSIRNLTIS